MAGALTDLSPTDRWWLLALARRTIADALDDGTLHLPPRAEVPSAAAAPGAAFVTLRRDDRLLGCIGSLDPVRPLADDVATHAFDAAFRDPRLPAVDRDDWSHMTVEISVLGPRERLEVEDRDALLGVLRPGVDGLVVTCREGRATFLPSVWDQVGSASEFVDLLWRKARFRPGRWPSDLVVERYQVVEFDEDDDRPDDES